MIKLIKFSLLIPTMILSLQSCANLVEPEHFEVKESVWSTLSPTEKQQVIQGYNQRKGQELEIERRQQEIDARNAPIRMAINALDRRSKRDTLGVKIRSISNKRIALENGAQFDVALFIGNDIRHWMPGQRIQTRKGEFGLYNMILINLDTHDSVEAKRL